MAEKTVPLHSGVFNCAEPHGSPLALAEALIIALTDLAVAERDLDGNPGFDPALAAWRAAADDARACVLAQCDSVTALPVTDMMTLCVQAVAKLVVTVVSSGDAAEVARIRMRISAAPWSLQVPADIPGAALCNAVLDAVLQALVAYIDGTAPQEPPPAAPGRACMVPPPASGVSARPMIHSAVSFAFAGLLRGLDACVAAERRLQRDAVSDALSATFAEDLRAAENARDALSIGLDAVISAPEQQPFDRALRLLALGLHTLLSVEDDGDRAHLHEVLAEAADLLLVPGQRPAAQRVRALQLHFFRSVAALMTMADYRGPGFDDGDDAPECVA